MYSSINFDYWNIVCSNNEALVSLLVMCLYSVNSHYEEQGHRFRDHRNHLSSLSAI